MQNVDNYITILIDSLKKKSKILDCISAENARQLNAMKAEPIDYDVLDDTMSKKQEYIEELNVMDSAFQKLYDRIQSFIQENKEQYVVQIRELKRLVQEVTDKSMNVQAEERRNRDAFSTAALNVRQKVKSVKVAKKVVGGYYESMNKLNVVEAQFMDQKK